MQERCHVRRTPDDGQLEASKYALEAATAMDACKQVCILGWFQLQEGTLLYLAGFAPCVEPIISG